MADKIYTVNDIFNTQADPVERYHVQPVDAVETVTTDSNKFYNRRDRRTFVILENNAGFSVVIRWAIQRRMFGLDKDFWTYAQGDTTMATAGHRVNSDAIADGDTAFLGAFDPFVFNDGSNYVSFQVHKESDLSVVSTGIKAAVYYLPDFEPSVLSSQTSSGG